MSGEGVLLMSSGFSCCCTFTSLFRSLFVSVTFAFLIFLVTFNNTHLVRLWLMVILAFGLGFMFYLLLC